MFNLGSPWILLFLPLPWLLLIFLPPKKITRTAALKVPFFQQIAALTIHTRKQKLRLPLSRKFLGYLIWILLVLAAAKPEWIGPPMQLNPSGRNLLLAVDI